MTNVSFLKGISVSLCIILFSQIPVFAEDSIPVGTHTTEALMRGERLFYGLIDGKFEDKACANCHNTVEIDTFNWNPDAWEIAHKYKNKSLADFIEEYQISKREIQWGISLPS